MSCFKYISSSPYRQQGALNITNCSFTVPKPSMHSASCVHFSSLVSERRRRGGEAEAGERETIPERGNRAAGEEEGKTAVSSGANVGHPEH